MRANIFFNSIAKIDSEFLYVEEKHDCKIKRKNVRKKRYFPSQTQRNFLTMYGIKKAKIESFAI